MTYVYQDFTTTTGGLTDVGLNYSDDDLTLPPMCIATHRTSG
jgi:hypothetical protein